MRRREFIAAWPALLVLPGIGFAQPQSAAVRTVAWFGVGHADDASPYLDALRARLRELGWIEGRNLVLKTFWAIGRPDMDSIAPLILAAQPDLIICQELLVYALLPLKPQMPVVFGFSGDPVQGNLVQSLARPNTRYTGMSYLAIDLIGKRLEFLKEWLPQTSHVAILAHPQHPGEDRERRATQEAGAQLGMAVSYFPFRETAEFEAQFTAIRNAKCDGLVVFPDSTMFTLTQRIAEIALAARLPSVSGWTPFARNGLLLSYGPNIRQIYRGLAAYADAILRGARPEELPVQLPTTFELALNLRTARALGLTPPTALLARADEVIE